MKIIESDCNEGSGKQSPQVFNISKDRDSYKISRRDLIKAAAISTAAITLTSCNPLEQSGISNSEELIQSTNTPAPTSTKTLIPTRTSTTTSTPTKIVVEVVTNRQGVNLRTGPGTNFLAIGSLAINVPMIAIAALADKSWCKVSVSLEYLPNLANAPISEDKSITHVDGWMRSDLFAAKSGSLDDLPIEELPATPTPLPNEKPTGGEGITYKYTDLYGNTTSYTLPCGSTIPEGAICVCNCVQVCSCDGYVAPAACNCDNNTGGSICTCDMVTYWYPN